jgi:pimeloyl-ACP methyl ester carboxylesterase
MEASSDTANLGDSGFVDSGGVKIHYVTKGTGPLVILIHGCPDHWLGWHNQIRELARHFQVVAVDLRGYNLSDQPEGVENYSFDKLLADVDAVLQHFNRRTATFVGHDWGGWIGWRYAMAHPDKTDRLVILNMPHPACLERELAGNPAQQKASDYARQFQQLPPGGRTVLYEGAAVELTPELFASGVKDPAVRAKYIEALRRSSLDGMMNYYKANYPLPPYKEQTYPPVKCPVLMIHGLDDQFLLPAALNDTWRWLDSEFTLVTVPGASHWVHHDAAELVTERIVSWLVRD